MDDIAISITGLHKSFGRTRALDGLDLEVATGEVHGFLGPNGAGKTTTISILCTLLLPTAGRAVVAGWDVVDQPTDVRRDIGLVFQELTLDDYLTAEENLQFHSVMYGVPRHEVRERVTPLLDMVGLTERRDQQVRFFSGGMKRRLEIARGLVHMPRVLFLDEPTIGLDPQTRAHIWDYIDDLRVREATTMFLTTHYMDEAERCDRIAIIDEGRIVAIDTPGALKASVRQDTVTLTTVDDDVAADELAAALGVTTERRNGALVAHVSDGEAFVPKLFDVISVGIRSVSVRRPSLDDVFIRYTGRDIRDADAGGADQLKANPMVRSFRKN